MKKQNDKKDEQRYNATITTDLALLALVLEVVLIICFDMFARDNLFGNLVSSVISLFLLALTYFVGLIPALATNLVFIFVVILGSSYEFLTYNRFNTGAFFWSVMPTLLCISFYFVTKQIRKLESENAQLKTQMSSISTLDAETNLRTVSIFKDHFDVFSTLARDYDFPLYLYVYRIKYWNAVSGLLSGKEQRRLMRIVSEVIDEIKTGHEFVYNIDHIPPTWGVLSTLSMDGKRKFRDEVKERLAERLKDDKKLSSVDIELEASKVLYNPKEHPTAATFLEDGIHELQYDVSVGSADNR